MIGKEHNDEGFARTWVEKNVVIGSNEYKFYVGIL